MSFNLLAIRETGMPPDPLYPTPWLEPDSVELDERDGECLPPFTASALGVIEVLPGGSAKPIVQLRKLKVTVRATEARMIVACSKYEKGGGWMGFGLGGLSVALAANAVSKARAAQRRAGKMLVGHVPYPWLTGVGYQPGSWPGHDQVRLNLRDPTTPGRALFLDIALPREHSGANVAQRLAGLAATYRLAHEAGQLDDATCALLANLQAPAALAPVPNKFVGYVLVNQHGGPQAAGACP